MKGIFPQMKGIGPMPETLMKFNALAGAARSDIANGDPLSRRVIVEARRYRNGVLYDMSREEVPV